MVSNPEWLCSPDSLAEPLGNMSRSSLLNLNSLGKICGSGNSSDMVILDRVKRKNSVRRMSIIEDGQLAEVLYLIPKQCVMEQLPFINPADYILCEKLAGIPAEVSVLHTPDSCQPCPPAGKQPIQCFRCGVMCKGEALRVQSSYFHIKCFTCKVCGCDLAQSGFFLRNGDCLCPVDFQRLHGTPCTNCGEFVEGEVVTVLGKSYHLACFVCTMCKQPFPAGDYVTFRGKECLCQRCTEPVSPSNQIRHPSYCSGCGRDIKNGQALLALGAQWHLGCFKCKACSRVLSGEYINKDGFPYCERDYQTLFGVKCEACQRFITGKVLEAGERHYHPGCARCGRCGKIFAEGEEMYVQGSTIWHPNCKDNNRTEESCRVSRPKAPCLDFFFPPHELKPNRSSSESSCSRPGSCTPSSPGRTICAKVDNEIIDYRDLAAIPRVKAIYDIEHPDMISYKSVNSSALDDGGNTQTRRRLTESPGNASETTEESFETRPCVPKSSGDGPFGGQTMWCRHSYSPALSRSPQHFHRPGSPSLLPGSKNASRPASPLNPPFLSKTRADEGFDLYRRPPVYKQQGPGSSSSQTASSPEYSHNFLSLPHTASYLHTCSDRFNFKVRESNSFPCRLEVLVVLLSPPAPSHFGQNEGFHENIDRRLRSRADLPHHGNGSRCTERGAEEVDSLRFPFSPSLRCSRYGRWRLTGPLQRAGGPERHL
ncbi:actin-binding LIM protein 1-like [Anableps anableps]